MKFCHTCKADVHPGATLEQGRGTVEVCPGCASVFPSDAPALPRTNPGPVLIRTKPDTVMGAIESLQAREAELVRTIAAAESARSELKTVRRVLRAAVTPSRKRASVTPLKAVK